MAGKIKKGFATYLLVLVIALVAAFLICVTVMLFSPFHNIMGLHYFYYDDEVYEYNVTDEDSDAILDFSTLEEIKINCSYAKVTVERYTMVDNHAVKITNKAKGFARANQESSFSYNVSFEDAGKTILNVEVNEPDGFLYFSKEVVVSILVPTTAGAYDLENTKIDITNTTGSIYIGNRDELTTQGDNEIDVNSLSVKTNSGRIMIYPVIEKSFDNVFVKTRKSDIDFATDIVVENSLQVYAKAGNISFKGIENKTPAIIDIANAKFSSEKIVGKTNLLMKSGYFKTNQLQGDLISNDSNSQMVKASIKIDEITGVVSLPFLNGSNLKIKKANAGSQIYAQTTSGSVNIDETYGKTYIKTTSGSVNVHTFADDIEVVTTSGDISVIYENSTIANQLDFATTSGVVNLEIKSDLAFVLVVYDLQYELRQDGVNIEWIEGDFTNPLTVHGGTKKIQVVSNSDVNISLLDVA